MAKKKFSVDELHRVRETEQKRILFNMLKKFGLTSVIKRKERRDTLKLYYDILTAVKDEMVNGGARPTRIQFLSNTSYDKCVGYLNELKKLKMIEKETICLTQKGYAFLNDFERINTYLEETG